MLSTRLTEREKDYLDLAFLEEYKRRGEANQNVMDRLRGAVKPLVYLRPYSRTQYINGWKALSPVVKVLWYG